MRRWVAVLWHASFSCLAAGLYFAFVLPRWWELMGLTPHTLGTVLRIVAGALIGLAALPVVFTLLRTRRPEFGTPRLALNLRTWSIVLHVLAGVLIIGTAVSEIWLSLDAAGPWLFGIYGAAAGIALLAIFTFYLAYLAETPPPPPKPLKPKAEKRRSRRGKKSDDAAGDEETTQSASGTEDSADTDDTNDTSADANDTSDTEEATEVTAADPGAESPDPAADEDSADEDGDSGGRTLRNRRPSSKADSTRRRRRRLRGGVAVDD